MISENELNGSIEYYEEIEESILSENETINKELLNEIRGLREDVQGLSNITVSVSVSDNNVSDYEISDDVATTISANNILNTPLNNYGLTDSMLAVFIVTGCIIGLILLMRKVIYKWS